MHNQTDTFLFFSHTAKKLTPPPTHILVVRSINHSSDFGLSIDPRVCPDVVRLFYFKDLHVLHAYLVIQDNVISNASVAILGQVAKIAGGV